MQLKEMNEDKSRINAGFSEELQNIESEVVTSE